MSAESWISVIVALTIGLLTGAIAVWAWAKREPSRGKLVTEVELRSGKAQGQHLLDVRLRNDGPRDIMSRYFDSGQPITVRLVGVNTHIEMSRTPGDITHAVRRFPGSDLEDSTFTIPPGKIARGGSWWLLIATDRFLKERSVSINATCLADIDVESRASGGIFPVNCL